MTSGTQGRPGSSKATPQPPLRRGFFAYPWDLLEEGPEEAVEAMAARYGCNAIALNAQYHHARLLWPRHAGSRIYQTGGALASFDPAAHLYGAGELLPAPDRSLVDARVLARSRARCEALGLDWGIWVVALHNSTLGSLRPDLCVRNCDGDVYPYALCPATRQANDYVCGLVSDIASQFRPQRLILEGVGYLGIRHGLHHELFMVAWDDVVELLYSLCFCPACVASAKSVGLDAESLAGRVAVLAGQLVCDERGRLPVELRQGEVASLLANDPELAAYLRLRTAAVTRLVARSHEVAMEHHVALEVIPASFHRPASQAWLEGASLPDLAASSDGLVVLAYHDSAASVAADLSWTAVQAPGATLIAGLNAGEPTPPSGAVLAELANACLAPQHRTAAIYYFNYGLLTPQRLASVARANASLRETG